MPKAFLVRKSKYWRPVTPPPSPLQYYDNEIVSIQNAGSEEDSKIACRSHSIPNHPSVSADPRTGTISIKPEDEDLEMNNLGEKTPMTKSEPAFCDMADTVRPVSSPGNTNTTSCSEVASYDEAYRDCASTANPARSSSVDGCEGAFSDAAESVSPAPNLNSPISMDQNYVQSHDSKFNFEVQNLSKLPRLLPRPVSLIYCSSQMQILPISLPVAYQVVTNQSTQTTDPVDLTDHIRELKNKLGLPLEQKLELVNQGYGVKNPFYSEPPDGPLKKNLQNLNDSDKKSVCPTCGKTFSILRLLNRHIKSHNSVKKYLCTFCTKGFNDTFDLKRHTRTHTGVRPYKCRSCDRSFTQRCSLESHTMKVHGVELRYGYKERRAKVFVCEICGHTSHDSKSYYGHIKKEHTVCQKNHEEIKYQLSAAVLMGQ